MRLIAARTSRLWLQIAMLCTGATLAIDNQVSHGSIVAANVIMSRFIAPFEMLIEGWWRWSNALAAFGRLRRLFAEHRSVLLGQVPDQPVAVIPREWL